MDALGAPQEREFTCDKDAKTGQPAQPLIIAAGLDRDPSTLGTTPFVETFLYEI
jgi:hypothetical protein